MHMCMFMHLSRYTHKLVGSTARRLKRLGVKPSPLNHTVARMWRSADAAAHGARCHSYTCALLRDLSGERTRCVWPLGVDSTPARGSPPSMPSSSRASSHAYAASHAASHATSHATSLSQLVAAIPALHPRGQLGGQLGVQLGGQLGGQLGDRLVHLSERPIPHVIHFMHRFKPWNPALMPLRHTQPFFYLWHAINQHALETVHQSSRKKSVTTTA